MHFFFFFFNNYTYITVVRDQVESVFIAQGVYIIFACVEEAGGEGVR